jgi:nitrogen fixation NifU-like protein
VNDLHALYRGTIRRHAADPTGYRRGIEATHRCEGHNPQCGDRVEIFLQLADGIIEDIAFDGEACTICLASASLLCENLAGQAVATVDAMARALEKRLKGPDPPDDDDPLAPLQGVRPYPSRIQCATLPWETAQRALASEL